MSDVFMGASTNSDGSLEYHVVVDPVGCLDCGMPYGGQDWLDLVLPRWQWLEIHPADGGVLCANCIVKRASKIPGAVSIHATIGISATELAKEYLPR